MQQPAWLVATIVLPVLVPLFGLLIGKFFPLDKEKYGKKTGFWSQFRDGQLGWVSVAWSIGAIYEIKHYSGRTDYLDGMEIAAFVLTFLGMVVSAGGAIEADEKKAPRKLFFLVSAVVAAFSAFVFYNSHVYIDNANAIAEKLQALKAMDVAPAKDGN